MTMLRMDNIGIVVEDLDAVIAFFTALGLELEGQQVVEGDVVDRMIGLRGVRADVAMLRSPDGSGGRIELSRFHNPAAIRAEQENAPANALGIRRIMFAVDDIDAALERVRAHGGTLVDAITQYENAYRLCNVRGPEGILIALAQRIG